MNPVASYSWDLNGDGTPEITGPEATVIAQYQFPGIYFPRVTVTDSQGNTYIEATMVNVLSREEMDALLRSKWDGMKVALLSGNMEAALQYFVAGAKNEYKEIFTELGTSEIASIFSAIINFDVATISGRLAERAVDRVEAGATYSYPVSLVKDENGIWKIMGF